MDPVDTGSTGLQRMCVRTLGILGISLPVHCGCGLVAGRKFFTTLATSLRGRLPTDARSYAQTNYFRNAVENREKKPDFHPSGGRVIFSQISGDSRPNREGWRVCGCCKARF